MPEALTLLLAGVFLASGIAKLRDPAGMVVLLRQAVSPTVPAFALTRSLAVAEVALGLLLLTGAAPRTSAAGSAVVLLAFTLALRAAARRAPVALASCHCFGGAGTAPPAQALIRNALLVGACLAVAIVDPSRAWDLPADELAGAVTVAGGLLCAWLLGAALVGGVVRDRVAVGPGGRR